MVRTHLVQSFFGPKFFKIRINSFRPKWKTHLVRKKRTAQNYSFGPNFIFFVRTFSLVRKNYFLIRKIYFFTRNLNFFNKNYVWSKNVTYTSVQKIFLHGLKPHVILYYYTEPNPCTAARFSGLRYWCKFKNLDNW